MAHALYEACTAPKNIHIVPTGLHKDLYERDSANLVQLIGDFARELRCDPESR